MKASRSRRRLPRLSLTLLGGFDARVGPRDRLELPRRKAQAVLAYLALSPDGAQPRDRLMALLWPDVPPAQAGNSLRQTIFTLRTALGPVASALVATPASVALDLTAVDVDVLTFERLAGAGEIETLAAAARLYRGDLLDGFLLAEAPFAEWLERRRHRLRESALRALGTLLTRHLEGDDTEGALATARRLLALDPLDERTHGAAMRLHLRRGQPAAALRQYETCAAVLRRQLGTRPGPEIQALLHEIRRRGPAAAPPRAPETTLVGRTAEIARLRDVLTAARGGSGQVVAILGEAGIGKSRLVEEIAAETRREHGRVAVGRCYQSQQIRPLGPWVDAVRHGEFLDDGDLLSSLAPAWRTELARLVPDLARGPAPRAGDQPRLFEALGHLLEQAAARQPLVLVLEDLHWADELSLRLVGFVAHRISSLPLVVVLTAREEDLPDVPVLRQLLRELDRDRRLSRIALGRLSRGDVVTIVEALLRDRGGAAAGLSDEIWSLSGGNPFVAVEAARAYRDGEWTAGTGLRALPARVRDLVAGRLDRLSGRALELARLAAVIGDAFELPVLQVAAGLTETQAIAPVEELVARRLLQERDRRLDFVHERLRDAVRSDILAPHLMVLHRRVAAALETVHGARLDEHAAAIGSHALAGGDWERAVGHLQRAGARAFAQGGNREAAACYEGALQALQALPEDASTLARSVDLLIDCRNALLPMGEGRGIAAALERAAGLAERLGDPGRQGRVASYLASYHWFSGAHQRALELAARALDVAKAIADASLDLSARYVMGCVHHALGDYRRALSILTPLLDVEVGGVTSPRYGSASATRVFVTSYVARCLAELGESRDAERWAEESVRVAAPLQHPFLLVHAHNSVAVVRLRQGRLADLVPALEQLREANRADHARGVFPMSDWFLAHAYALAGRPEALDTLRRAAEVTEAAEFPFYRPFWLLLLGEGYLRIDRVDDARREAERALALARERGERGHEGWSLRLLGEVLAAGGPAAARTAEDCYRRGEAIAVALGAEPLRALCRLGRRRLPAPGVTGPRRRSGARPGSRRRP
jgi:DNA-binding SARP family transcriptional activator